MKVSPVSCLVALGFLLFAVVGSALAHLLGARNLLHVHSARNWVETPCVILASQVAGGAEGTRIDVLFEYEFEGRQLESDRYGFVDFQTDDLPRHEAAVEGLPPGTQTVCYVDATNPTRAVLDREFSPALYWLFLPLGIAFVGLTGLLVLVVRWLRAPR